MKNCSGCDAMANIGTHIPQIPLYNGVLMPQLGCRYSWSKSCYDDVWIFNLNHDDVNRFAA